MPWEQMDLPEMSGRLMLVAGYLARRIYGWHIVDLNCGTAPLLGFLPMGNDPEWGWYYGNDTNKDFIDKCRMKGYSRTTFEQVPDTDVLGRLKEHNIDTDVLVCLGYGARYHPLESAVVDDVIVEIAVEHSPRNIVLGAWMPITMLARFGFNVLLDRLEKAGYTVDSDWSIESNLPTTPYSRRRVVMLKL